jgi:hypothetical protein
MKNSALTLSFPAMGHREVLASFDGGDITSDAGLLVVAAADQRAGVTAAMASAFVDLRDPHRIDHTRLEMLRERVYAIAMGYEDANDLDRLNGDPALKLACGRLPQSGKTLASQPSLSRQENAISAREQLQMAKQFARVGIAQLPAQTWEVTLDVDATEDPCHGQQQLECFNGFYDSHCYLPLMLYATGADNRQWLLGTVLRPGTARSQGLGTMLKWAVRLLRERFPHVKIILRGDSGFGNRQVLRWCHALGIGYRLCIPPNAVLHEKSIPVQIDAALLATYPRPGEDGQEFGEFRYRAQSWDREERVIVKAEVTNGKMNPRFVVTSGDEEPEQEYRIYCARGDRENRIKEFKCDMASGRTSCHRFLANQYRVLMHSAAYLLMQVIQQALTGTSWAAKQVGTLRTRLLKIGARVVESCRRVLLHLPTSCPVQEAWAHLHQHLC